MGTTASVSVDNNFSSCQSGITMRTAYHKLACRVDKKLEISDEISHLGRKLSLDARYKYLTYILLYTSLHSAVSFSLCLGSIIGRLYELIVLSGDHYGVDTQRTIVLVIFHCDLALGVGTQISEHSSALLPCHMLCLAAYVGELAKQTMGKIKGERHIIGSLVAGIAEHHALVAGTLSLCILTLDTTVDIGTLFMQG